MIWKTEIVCYAGCEKCPGDKAIRQFVESRFDIDNDVDENEDSVKYRQWIKNEDGKTNLVWHFSCVTEYIDKIFKSFEDLLPHQFIAKSQAWYLSDLKEILKENTVIIVLDFA